MNAPTELDNPKILNEKEKIVEMKQSDLSSPKDY